MAATVVKWCTYMLHGYNIVLHVRTYICAFTLLFLCFFCLRPPQTYQDWLSFLLVKVPIIQWVWTYKLNYLIGDIISGITVAIMHIPQGQWRRHDRSGRGWLVK